MSDCSVKITKLHIRAVKGGVWITGGEYPIFNPYTADELFGLCQQFNEAGRETMKDMPFTVDE